MSAVAVKSFTSQELVGLPNTAKTHLKQMLATHAPELTFEQYPKSIQERAQQRKTLVLAVEAIMTEHGKSMSSAVEVLIAAINNGEVSAGIRQAAIAVVQKSAGKKAPHRSRLIDWCNRYRAYGITGLIDAHKGRQREFYGWEVQALHYWLKPVRAKAAIISGWLQDEGWQSATKSRVQSFFKNLPEQLNKEAPQRQGLHHYRQNHTPYVIRDNDNIPVGFIYTGDGHCCDAYVAHPVTGKHWRPELTLWLDVRSHYPVGWYLSEAESGINTLFSLSQAIVQHDHVPPAIYVDPGSGFKNRMMNDKTLGYYARMGIEPLIALPGNARGKGLIEGSFNHYEEYVGKKFQTYCGHCRTDDELRLLEAKIKRGDIKLPTLMEYWDEVCKYFERYKITFQANLGYTPAALWQELEQVELGIPAEAIIRPVMQRTVSHWRIRMFNRRYGADALQAYEGKKVITQYNLHDLTVVAIFDEQHRFICDAKMVSKTPGLPDSRIEEIKQISTAKKIERKQRHIDEIVARAKPILTLEDNTSTLEDLTADFDLITDDEDFNESYINLGLEDEGDADQSNSPVDWL